MYLINKKVTPIVILFFLATNVGFANSSIKFFASNNTREINLETAHERLMGKEQIDLQNNMISVLQENHIEQGKFEDILGSYQMSSDQNITADNSERFDTSPKQNLSDEKIFSLAKELAIKLNQESIAVFIPDQSMIGNMTVSFTSHPLTINEIVDIIHKKLPALYSQAFSIHLENKSFGFDTAKVTEIEWLGSGMQLKDIQTAFPQEKIHYEYGKVFLVFQNGQKEAI